MLPWAIARAVGLGRRPPAAVEGPVVLPASLLGDAHDRLAAGDRTGADEVLGAWRHDVNAVAEQDPVTLAEIPDWD